MDNSVEARIAGARLSPNDKLVLEYILKNREVTCFQTATEIADALNISPSSVIRVPAKLGYESFGRFKRVLQEELADLRLNTIKKPVPYERIKNHAALTEDELIEVMKENAFKNVERDRNTSDYMNYKRAAGLISSAERVYIVGFRTCGGFATVLGISLNCVRPSVHVVSGGLPLVDSLADLTERDVVIALSYERYSSDTLFAVKIAKRAGSRIVALTDKYTSPLCPDADAVILNSTENMSFYNSYVSLTMSIEILVGLVSRKNKTQNEERLKKMEEYLQETGQY